MSLGSESHLSDETQNRHEKSKSSSWISWNSGVNLANNSGTNDFLRFGSMISSTTSENSTKTVITKSGILSNLTVQLVTSTGNGDASPGEGKSRTFTVRKNGVNTSLLVTIADSATNGSNDDPNNAVSVEKYDLISLVHNVTNGPTNSALGIASVQIL